MCTEYNQLLHNFKSLHFGIFWQHFLTQNDEVKNRIRIKGDLDILSNKMCDPNDSKFFS